MASLSEDQRRRIAENRAKALETLQRKRKPPEVSSNPPKIIPTPPSFSNAFSSGHKKGKAPLEKQKKTSSKFNAMAKKSKSQPSKLERHEIAFSLKDPRSFEARMKYHAAAIAVFRTMDTRSYDPKTTRWSFNVDEYKSLVGKLRQIEDVKIDPLPVWALAITRSSKPKFDCSCLSGGLYDALMPFQKEGVQYGIEHGGRVLIADEMGLGKTLQALCLAQHYSDDWPLLIICPSSLRMTWKEAILTWLPDIKPYNISVSFSVKECYLDNNINIISYDIAVRVKDKLATTKFDIIIADESHFLKNFKTARAKAVLPVLKSSKRAILLSGTPALSRPVELYTQVSSLIPSLFKSFPQFGMRYCDGHQSAFGWDYSGSSNLEELQIILEETVMIRRLKRNVLLQLPPKFRQFVILDPTLVKVAQLKSAQRDFDKTKGSDKRAALLQFFSLTSQAKLPAVQNYVSDLLEGENKFVIFGHHKVMLDGICESVGKTGRKFIRIDGRTPAEERQALCDRFQQGDADVAVLSVTAANTGLTLTAATCVVFAELYWNPGVLVQAEDRVYRIGQNDSVSVRYLVGKGTADDHLRKLIDGKLAVLGKAGLSRDDFTDCKVENQKDRTQKTVEDCWGDDMDKALSLLDVVGSGSDPEGEPLSKRQKLS